MEYYAEKEQAFRRKRVIQLAAEKMECGFDESGKLISGRLPKDVRLALHVALIYLMEGSKEKAVLGNKILQANLPGKGFCHFSPFLCMEIFFHCGTQLREESKERMDEYVLRWIDAMTEPELEVIGCNDNFPLMAAGALLGSGLRYGRADLLRAAAYRIDQMDQLLKRRGFTSEYTSPTYTPIQALCLSEIACFAGEPGRLAERGVSEIAAFAGEARGQGQNACRTEIAGLLADIRKKALYAEMRVHIDLLTHMHWPTAQIGGACSRGYARDIMGSFSHARFVYYMLYGDELAVDPVDAVMYAKGEKAGQIAKDDEDFLRAVFAWHAAVQYHCPSELAEWAKNRNYPYTVIGTAESVSGRDLPPMECAPMPSGFMPDYWEYPEHVNLVTAYMTEDYCLGTARYGWLGGIQSHNLHLLYRKNREVRGQRDVGVMFTRYVINDHEIFGESYTDWEMGVCVTQQKEDTAIALYSPRLLYDRGIKSLKLTVNFSDLFGEGVREIWLGKRQLKIPAGGTCEDVCVYVHTGDLYICLKPLMESASDGRLRCVVRRVKHLIEISFINYAGPERCFERMELGKMRNGVAVEVRHVKDFKSFEHFRQAMQPIVQDRMFEYFGRAVRKFRYENDGNVLENEYSPLSLNMRYAMENGKLTPEPRLYSSQALPGIIVE